MGVDYHAQSGTHGAIFPAGSMVSGTPAFDHKQWLRSVTAFMKLPGNGAGHSQQRSEGKNDRRPHRKKTDSRAPADDQHDNLILRSAILRSNGY